VSAQADLIRVNIRDIQMGQLDKNVLVHPNDTLFRHPGRAHLRDGRGALAGRDHVLAGGHRAQGHFNTPAASPPMPPPAAARVREIEGKRRR